MSTNMTTECVFPAELICQILYHADPRDIIRWRTVSKWFCNITRGYLFWTTLYENAAFPRPPGPSPSQSIASLERTLVKSARLAQSWTTQPMRVVSNTKIHLYEESGIRPELDPFRHGRPSTHPRLIHGRWLIVQESRRRFVLHDVNDSNSHAPQVLWEEEQPVMGRWGVCSTASVKGQCIAHVFLYMTWDLAPWRSLEFRWNDESGEVCGITAMDPPAFTHDRDVEFRNNFNSSPFLVFDRVGPSRIVFDMRIRVFCRLPEFRVALDETRWELGRTDPPTSTQMAFTDTHLIAFNYLGFNYSRPSVLIQAFAFPPDGSPIENDICVLRLTHECASYTKSTHVEVLRAFVDSITGISDVKLLGYSTIDPGPIIACIDLTLPKSSGTAVLPMTIRMQHFSFQVSRILSSYSYFWLPFLTDMSSDRYVRGFYRGRPRSAHLDTEYVIKFTIDIHQGQWAITCGESSPVSWGSSAIARLPHRGLFMFDGMRGKLYHIDPEDEQTIGIVDIE